MHFESCWSLLLCRRIAASYRVLFDALLPGAWAVAESAPPRPPQPFPVGTFENLDLPAVGAALAAIGVLAGVASSNPTAFSTLTLG